MRPRWPAALVVFGLLFLVWSPPAHAYLDPGSGSLVFQLVVGFLAGGLFAMKMLWQRLRFALAKRPRGKPGQGPDDAKP